ncbi:MAG TPA: hypothetical protein VMV77_07920 [Bacteroidales bacterium]|nr:hypothetical protein [Bacteroidales bacterium]
MSNEWYNIPKQTKINAYTQVSEDIDLTLDGTFLGVEGKLTRNGMKTLRKKTGKYISEKFSPELEARLKEKGLVDISLNYIKPESSDADPAQVAIHYPNVIKYPAYIQPGILLEISCSSLKGPNTVQTFYSLLDEHYLESAFAGDQIDVCALNGKYSKKFFYVFERKSRE